MRLTGKVLRAGACGIIAAILSGCTVKFEGSILKQLDRPSETVTIENNNGGKTK